MHKNTRTKLEYFFAGQNNKGREELKASLEGTKVDYLVMIVNT